ncbi:MAG: DUF3592 domain-containing protein [Planctomycetota bacterium]
MDATPEGDLDLAALRPKGHLTLRLMFDGLWKAVTILGLIFALVGVGTVLVALHLVSAERQYEREGKIVKGTVTKKDTYTSRSRSGTGRRRRTRTRRHYRVYYTFEAPDGKTRSGRDTVSSGLWRSLGKGSAIDIQYLPSDPDRHRAAAAATGSKVWLVWLFPVGFGGAGLLMVGIAARRARKYAPLLRNGTLTRAAVDSKEMRTDITINKRHPHDIHYTFALPDGTVQTGKDLVLDQALAERLEPGSPIGIIYQPDHPERCALFRNKWLKFFEQ